MTPRELAARFARADLARAMGAALEGEAAQLADAVRARLSEPAGGAHDAPWLHTGELRDSIGHQADGLEAAVGSTSDVALYQELGTARLPPRPFLAPAAAENGEAIAQAAGQAVFDALKP
jgi:HK97 gp10 family phage protein